MAIESGAKQRMKKAMQDSRMQPDMATLPFDGKRLVFGGFKAMVDK